MSKMEFLDPLEAEKFKKQKCVQFCRTPCILNIVGEKFQSMNINIHFVTQYQVRSSMKYKGRWTVPPFKMHPGGTVPLFKMYRRGTLDSL